jgi:hypothetical protein
MKISLLFLFALVSLPQSWAFEKNAIIEHQVRICDSEGQILEKLNLKSNSVKKRDIFYIETADQFYRTNGWVIRLKVKSSMAIIDIKKRFRRADIVPAIKNLECEYDKHGPSVEKSCKLSSEIPVSDVKNIINQNKSWINILSSAQKKWLKLEDVIRTDAYFNGILKDKRYEIEHPVLGTITLDTVYLDSNPNITYHEISLRYNEQDEHKMAVLLDNFIQRKNVILCPNQLDWAINKFDVMTVLDHF